LVFQSPQESKAADPEFYVQTYRQLYQASEEPTPKDLKIQRQRAALLVNLLHSKTNLEPQRVLDIGASTGVLLKTLQDHFDCDAIGVEPGEAYRDFAESNGLTMFPSLDALEAVKEDRFELVSLIHVLEHLTNPLGTLSMIRKELIAEEGILLLEVPNFYAHDSYELAHMTCYTPHTLQEMVQQAGFQVISLSRSGAPRSRLLPLYLTLIAKPREKNSALSKIKPDRFVRLKRRLGFLYRRIVQKLFPHKAWLPLPQEKGN
jgi:predicted TPR repeat methyltransferase